MGQSKHKNQRLWTGISAAAPRKVSIPLLVQLWFLAMLLLACQFALAQQRSLEPSQDLSPEEVVQIVVSSLQINDEANDNGIATVFNFASPGNKSQTGPLPRFASMIKSGFSDMLNHTSARFDPMQINGNTAVQAVWLLTPSGKEVGYGFRLGLQQSGAHAGSWMTDAVVPLGPGAKSGTRI